MHGCTGWTWNTPRRFAPTEGELPVVADVHEAGLSPEAYAIGHWSAEGLNLSELRQRAEAAARRRGAQAVLLADFTATSGSLRVIKTGDLQSQREVARRQELEVHWTEAAVSADALRQPERCIGLEAACVGLAACDRVQVLRVVLGGPASEAGVEVGDVLTGWGRAPIAHPWDLHRLVDSERPGPLHTVRDDVAIERQVTPSACEQVYPR